MSLLLQRIPAAKKSEYLGEITKEEIAATLCSFNLFKVPDIDAVFTRDFDLYKKELMENLHKEFNAWRTDPSKIKTEMVSGKTLLFNKKKNTFTAPKDMRPITLLNSAYKLFTKIIANRILQATRRSKKWDNEQQCILKGRRGIVGVHMFSEATRVFVNRVARRSISIAYIDYEKAYDSVNPKALLSILEKIIGIISELEVVREFMGKWETRLYDPISDKCSEKNKI